jgi:hypothetical protein
MAQRKVGTSNKMPEEIKKSAIDRLEERIKLSIFQVVTELLKNFEISFWRYFILIIIDFF